MLLLVWLCLIILRTLPTDIHTYPTLAVTTEVFCCFVAPAYGFSAWGDGGGQGFSMAHQLAVRCCESGTASTAGMLSTGKLCHAVPRCAMRPVTQRFSQPCPGYWKMLILNSRSATRFFTKVSTSTSHQTTQLVKCLRPKMSESYLRQGCSKTRIPKQRRKRGPHNISNLWILCCICMHLHAFACQHICISTRSEREGKQKSV